MGSVQESLLINRYSILQYFVYNHLPQYLQDVSKQYHDLAFKMADLLPNNAETAVALRKLLESKDAAVRAALPNGN